MATFQKYEPCPACRSRGRDRRGDNLARYNDGSGHCFSCAYHEHASLFTQLRLKQDAKKATGPLPRDFTREVPAAAWKWLLQYGLPFSYWKPFTGYSPAEQRLILTHGGNGGNPELSVGRFVGTAEGELPRKWKQWGDKLRSATVLGNPDSCSYEGVILVEDLVSAHKVAQVALCLPLFGTTIYPKVIAALRALKRPVVLWLDEDQWEVLPPKINRLQTFLGVPVSFCKTDKDPKEYTVKEIYESLQTT